MSVVSPSLDRKIYVRSVGHVIVYDPRDGKCEKTEIPKEPYSRDVCVVDNVLYIYCIGVGLMWYNSKEKEWRVVNGISTLLWFPNFRLKVALAEYNGNLAVLQQLSLKKSETIVWCVMIALERNGEEITGKVAWFERLLSITDDYKIMHCLARTDS
ncbi:unnamed protein product [Microthlaspi erraticum]|uniref:FKB95-like N-terminal Kelch domain-containing protein n=1 Tax=Microthlaspi erraticum TaxID=1685480 RepID=A0A6D2LN37_9BRAS|nr:unnamed protein product [Microthlaspi erraticum]